MERRYGNPNTIFAAYRREIKKWPLIKPGDSAALKKFYSFLIKCQSITVDITWNALNTPDTQCSLLAKLPGNMKDRLNRLAYTASEGIRRGGRHNRGREKMSKSMSYV